MKLKYTFNTLKGSCGLGYDQHFLFKLFQKNAQVHGKKENINIVLTFFYPTGVNRLGLKNKLFVSCNGPEKNRVDRSVKNVFA